MADRLDLQQVGFSQAGARVGFGEQTGLGGHGLQTGAGFGQHTGFRAHGFSHTGFGHGFSHTGFGGHGFSHAGFGGQAGRADLWHTRPLSQHDLSMVMWMWTQQSFP